MLQYSQCRARGRDTSEEIVDEYGRQERLDAGTTCPMQGKVREALA